MGAWQCDERSGPVGGGHENVLDSGEPLLEAGHRPDTALTVVSQDDERVAVEELVQTAGGVDERSDRLIAPGGAEIVITNRGKP